MKRKIVALVIIAIMLVSSAFCVSAENPMNTFFEKMLSVEAEERDSYITLLAPMFMVDSGIESLQGFVRDYQPDKEDSYLNAYIGKMLEYTDKQTLIKALETVKCTNLQARRDFLETLKNKTSLQISDDTEKAINVLLEESYEDLPALKKLLEEGGYEAGSLAKLINCVVEINGSNEFYIYNGKTFSAGSIDAKLEKDINKIWEDYVLTENGLELKAEGIDGEALDLSEILEASAEKLNEHIASSDREEFATALSEIGVVKITNKVSNDGASASPSDTQEGSKDKETIIQPTKDEEKEITVEAGQTKTLSFETTAKRPVLYKKDGDNLVLIKYSALYDGKLIAKVFESGTYVVKDSTDKFTDCVGWAKEYIEVLASRGIINGKASGIYAPNDTITREEFVKLIVELLDIEKSDTQTIFADVNTVSWYAGYVSAAYENKIISGMSQTHFGIGAPIRRQDMAKIINTVLEQKGIKGKTIDKNVFGDFNDIADYAQEHILSIYSMGIISGDTNGNFNPESYATRAEAAKMVYGMLVQIINN